MQATITTTKFRKHLSKETPNSLPVTPYFFFSKSLENSNLLSVLQICLSWVFHVNGFYNWLLSLKIMFSRFMYAVASFSHFILFYCLGIPYLIFIHSTVDRHLDCFHLILNNIPMNIFGKFLFRYVFSGFWGIGMEPLGHMETLSYFEELSDYFSQRLHHFTFHQECMKDLICPHTCQHFLLSVF